MTIKKVDCNEEDTVVLRQAIEITNKTLSESTQFFMHISYIKDKEIFHHNIKHKFPNVNLTTCFTEFERFIQEELANTGRNDGLSIEGKEADEHRDTSN